MEKSAAFYVGFSIGVEKVASTPTAALIDAVGGVRIPSAVGGALAGAVPGAIAGGLGGAAGAKKGDRFRAAGKGALVMGGAGAALGGASGLYGGHKFTRILKAMKDADIERAAMKAKREAAEAAERNRYRD